MNLLSCGKDIIDICDILNNNLILGMKINHVIILYIGRLIWFVLLSILSPST